MRFSKVLVIVLCCTYPAWSAPHAKVFGGGGDGDEKSFRRLMALLDRWEIASGSKSTGSGRPEETTADGTTTAAAANATTKTTTATAVTDAATPDRRVKYATESQCTSANGGRPCVCSVPDFLARLRRTHERDAPAAAANEYYECASYVAAPKALVASSAAAAVVAAAQPIVPGETHAADGGTSRKRVDLDRVVHDDLDLSKGTDAYTVHYGLVSSDLKVKCLRQPPNTEGADMVNFKWDATVRHKSNSTVTGANTNTLLILGLEPKDSRIYTCVVSTIDETGKTVEKSYKHYVIAVERPEYEIRGTTVYRTSKGGCKDKIINPLQKLLPNLMLNELCPDGASGYACDVAVRTFNCNEDKNTLDVSYSITQNDNLNNIVKSTKKGHKALDYQKMLAGVSGIFQANLNKMLTIPIVSKNLFNTHFKPDRDSKIESFVACPPGFGIKEIFCAACPLHHYSPNNSADCFKCPKGFYQPVAGSDNCAKCPNIFADGCSYPVMGIFDVFVRYLAIILLVFGIILEVLFCMFCCRDAGENSADIKIIPGRIHKKIKKRILRYKSKNHDRSEARPDTWKPLSQTSNGELWHN